MTDTSLDKITLTTWGVLVLLGIICWSVLWFMVRG